MYKIIFSYKDASEIIDYTDNLTEANFLLNEYRTAFKNIKGCYVYMKYTNFKFIKL